MRYALTIVEVAKSLGVSPNTIRNMINAGTLPHYRAGRRVLVPVAALEQIAAGQAGQATNEGTRRAGGR